MNENDEHPGIHEQHGQARVWWTVHGMGTQTEPVEEEETENDYKNIGKFIAQLKWISNVMWNT